jgi:hypothetical protein
LSNLCIDILIVVIIGAGTVVAVFAIILAVRPAPRISVFLELLIENGRDLVLLEDNLH